MSAATSPDQMIRCRVSGTTQRSYLPDGSVSAQGGLRTLRSKEYLVPVTALADVPNGSNSFPFYC